MTVIRIALPVPLRSQFDYRYDDANDIAVGMRVEVPFGRQTMMGIVEALNVKTTLGPEQLKPVCKVLDEKPIFSVDVFKWLRWCSQYYHHPFGDVLQAALPVKLRQGKANNFALPSKWRLTEAGLATDLDTITQKAPKQATVLTALLAGEPIPPGHSAPSKALEKKLWIESYTPQLPELNDITHCIEEHAPLRPSQQQAVAIAAISAQSHYQSWLLEGITGSGKTEVYMQTITPFLKAGKQILILVPEIGLTPQTVQRFERRFGVSVGALHSGLNDEERFSVWYQAKYGHIAIVIGTRSAVFTDFKNLGIIIIDEEHDNSFKQQDGFRYHARDIAAVRAKQLNIPLVLGSATPSLESLFNVQQGKFNHLTLSQRAGNAQTAPMELVDIRHQDMTFGLSPYVLNAMEATLSRGEQVMVFMNRRGFAPAVICHDCGHNEICHGCDRPLTIHLAKRQMHCHHCETVEPLAQSCSQCGSHNLHYQGVGTEQLEAGLQSRFPHYSSTRIDSDSVRGKHKLNQTLDAIKQGKHQLLIGTQILAKGHHFPDVTLVVIVDVDSALFSADFRAYEQLSQLIVQVSGRAGRAQKPGRVMIQTHQPGHPLLQDLVNNGYQDAAQLLLQERVSNRLPPHSFQVLFRAEHKDPMACLDFLTGIKTIMSSSPCTMLGPVPCLIEKRQLRFRFQLIIQHQDRSVLHQWLSHCLPNIEALPSAPKVRWHLDVDPHDFN